jgi:arginyl-tRNA synthetase
MFLDAGRRANYLSSQTLDHVMFGAILGEDGKPIKTKSGESVKLSDVLDEAVRRALVIVSEKNTDLSQEEKEAVSRAVGIGAIKYFDLNKDRLSDYDFSWGTMLAMDGNTAPYLQFAHARIRSIFRKAEGYTPNAAIKLDAPQELTLAKH